MAEDLLTALSLSVPLIIAGALHMAVVRFDVLPVLRRPLNRRLFGANKTWRGLLLMPLATVVGVAVAQALTSRFSDQSPWRLGLALGFAYALFELPNSWLKRRLGIAPGKRPTQHRFMFTLLDQADSAIGAVIVYRLMMNVPVGALVACLLLGPAIHLAVNFSLYLSGLRKEPA
jgi:CDP-diacylglycerol--serine O-phosphatidyltransferase